MTLQQPSLPSLLKMVHRHSDQWRIVYGGVVTATGLSLVVWAGREAITTDSLGAMAGLMLLAGILQYLSTVTRRAGMTIGFSQAVSLASAALFGLPTAILVSATAAFSIWLWHILSKDRHWKGSWEQLGFNLGMDVIAVTVGSIVLITLRDFWGVQTLLGQSLPWVAAAIVNDQVNFWLVSVILYLQRQMTPLQLYRQQRWAMPLNIVATILGSSLLVATIATMGLSGIILFVITLTLTAYAFRVYVKQTEAQMDVIRQQTEALTDANEKLTAFDREKRKFSRILSHDMRTALTSIRLYGQMLRDRPNVTPDKRQRMLQVLLLNEQNLAELIDNLLQVQGLQAEDPIPVERKVTALRPLLWKAVTSMNEMADEKAVELRFDEQANDFFVNIDSCLMLRAVNKILSNAIKYTQRGGKVLINTWHDDGDVVIVIRDTGCGISAENLPHIFEPFKRLTEDAPHLTGVGVGLSIAKHYIELNDGSLEAESHEGVGSTFYIRLRLHKEID